MLKRTSSLAKGKMLQSSGSLKESGLKRSQASLGNRNGSLKASGTLSQENKQSLKRIAKNNQERMQKYYKMVEDHRKDHPRMTCEVCGNTFSTCSLDPHHPKGRAGMRLFEFIFCCRRCHNRIHDNPSWAKEKGLLV